MVSIESVFFDYFVYQPLDDDDDYDIGEISGFSVAQTFATEAVGHALTVDNIREAVEALQRDAEEHEEHMRIHREYLEALREQNNDFTNRVLGQFEYTEA